jgi:C-terminal processing protease CtpA/Prc
MPAPTGAYVIRNALVKIGSTVYTNQVTKVRLVPDTPIQTLRTLVPDGAVTDVDSTAWTLELSGVQDWTNTTGIADALNDAAGTQITMTIAPKNVTGQMQAVVVVYAIPPEFGGEQGNFNLFEIQLPVVGVPTFSAIP